MTLVVINKKKVFVSLTIIFIFVLVFLLFLKITNPIPSQMVMGGILYTQNYKKVEEKAISKAEDVEKYVRPSDLPVLNNRNIYSVIRFFSQNYQNKVSEIVLPKELLKSPEETLINYFSVLRDAANIEAGKHAGCGSIGWSETPYPVAYHFLSEPYQKKLSYEEYLESFENILHTSLIKYNEVPVYNNQTGMIRYFIEIETIGGSEKNIANFTYYYGFIDLIKRMISIKYQI